MDQQDAYIVFPSEYLQTVSAVRDREMVFPEDLPGIGDSILHGRNIRIVHLRQVCQMKRLFGTDDCPDQCMGKLKILRDPCHIFTVDAKLCAEL